MTFQPFEDPGDEGELRLILVRASIQTHTSAGEPAFEIEPLVGGEWCVVNG